MQGQVSDMEMNGPTFVPKSGYCSIIWVKVCPQKLAFSLIVWPILRAGFFDKMFFADQ